jgi:hypothetical protein
MHPKINHPVYPELVEGLFFFPDTTASREGQGFDKLSLDGLVCLHNFCKGR